MRRGSVINSIAFSADGRTVAAGGVGGRIYLLDGATHEARGELRQDDNHLTCVAYSDDGRFLASATDNGKALLRDGRGDLITTLVGHSAGITSLAFSADGERLVTGGGSGDSRIIIWRCRDGRKDREIRVDDCFYGILALTISPDGKTLASTGVSPAGGGDSTAFLWDLSSGALVATLVGHAHAVSNLSYSSDGRFLASGGYDNTVYLRDTSDQDHPKSLLNSKDAISKLLFHPRFSILAVARGSGYHALGNLMFINVETGKSIEIPLQEKCTVFSMAFHPDGKTLATNSYNNIINFYAVGPIIDQLTGGPGSHAGEMKSVGKNGEKGQH